MEGQERTAGGKTKIILYKHEGRVVFLIHFTTVSVTQARELACSIDGSLIVKIITNVKGLGITPLWPDTCKIPLSALRH